ncbi:MAG: asparagine synthase (glutamine-hydrolyzing) [Vicinamibacterales bacterium]
MCGLTGAWAWNGATREQRRASVTRMTATLAHRGPDDTGVLVDDESGVALGFRRLSIIDLSAAGHQPMESANGRFVLTYNGEIYNHDELRGFLTGVRWRGSSDSEVILEAFAQWGIEPTLRRLIGMFAIALWDRQDRVLTLMRDRMGKKPLYYAHGPHGVMWGSELKSLCANESFDRTLDEQALQLYFRLGYIPSPFSIYRSARKVEPGCYVTCRVGAEPQSRRYWSARDAAHAGVDSPHRLDEREAVEALDELLGDAVSHRMIADVPLGAFLSGGVDSSAVVAMMQTRASRPVRTFSLGFPDAAYDEAPFARAVAEHLGTDHTELYVDPKQTQAVIPDLPSIYDEPFADSSQVPTFLVSRLARQHVTVALSGDGGDEVFGGYNRHMWLERIWQRTGHLPFSARRFVARAIRSLPESAWDRAYATVAPFIGRGRRVALPGDKLHKISRVVESQNPDEAYLQLVSQWPDPRMLLAHPGERVLPIYTRDPKLGVTESVMLLDQLTYLPEDILAKVDRASMAVSLEARVPLLDHRIVEWAWRVPADLRTRNGVSKWLLRQVLYKHVPPALIERPKFGFGVPIGRWLRDELRDWAEHLLSPAALKDSGLLHAAPIRRTWQEHLDGRRDWQHRLWVILMFQAWRERWSRA